MTNFELLNRVVDIARGAGSRIMPIYASDCEVEYKEDESPLTTADKASHEYIVDKLEKYFPEIPILSEESSGIAWETRKGWREYWLIDPLDGTKEFIKKNDEFTVNIALVRQNVSVLGVVYAPVHDICWYGAEGKGAYRMKGVQAPERIQASSPEVFQGMRIVGSRSHQSESIKQFMNYFEEPELLPMGSSLKMCAVADGTADTYPRLGLTSEWDTAAAHCVVSEAGGFIVDEAGHSLVYNSKESLLNPYFLVLGRSCGSWRSQVIQWFKESSQ